MHAPGLLRGEEKGTIGMNCERAKRKGPDVSLEDNIISHIEDAVQSRETPGLVTSWLILLNWVI